MTTCYVQSLNKMTSIRHTRKTAFLVGWLLFFFLEPVVQAAMAQEVFEVKGATYMSAWASCNRAKGFYA